MTQDEILGGLTLAIYMEDSVLPSAKAQAVLDFFAANGLAVLDAGRVANSPVNKFFQWYWSSVLTDESTVDRWQVKDKMVKLGLVHEHGEGDDYSSFLNPWLQAAQTTEKLDAMYGEADD